MSRQASLLAQGCFGVAVLAAATSFIAARDQEADLERFRREAQRGWAELEGIEAGLEFVVRVTETRAKAKRPEDREKQYVVTWRRAPGCLLLERADIENGQVARRTVVAANEQYEFSARLSGPDGDNWQLKMFRMRRPNDADSTHFLIYQAYLFPMTSIVNASGRRLSEMMNDPDFHLLGAEAKGGRVHVRLNFIDKAGSRPGTPGHGEIEFDPEMNWAVREYQLTDGATITISRKAEFSERLYGHYRVPARIITEYRRFDNPATVNLRRTADFESVRRSTASPEMFRLSAYNLPEPPGAVRPASTGLRFLIIVAAVCGGLAALFWWLARRRRRVATREMV